MSFECFLPFSVKLVSALSLTLFLFISIFFKLLNLNHYNFIITLSTGMFLTAKGLLYSI